MKVLILAGGESEEKSISLSSGAAVYKAICSLPGFTALLVDPATESWQQIPCDIVFPVLHGAGGEDGALQNVLEQSDRRFVGSSSKACELTFDKAACSALLNRHGVKCPAEVCVKASSNEDSWHAAFDRLNAEFPESKQWVVKPNQQGSSIGMTLIKRQAGAQQAGGDTTAGFLAQLSAAIRQALQFDQTCLIQQYIGGREITVSMLDGIALSPIEIRVPSGFYDFHAKYSSGETLYDIVHDAAAGRCAELAMKINEWCGTRGIVRIDFRVDEQGQPWFLELNTIPGMTNRSLVPKSAADCGWSLADLCQRAIENGLRRPIQGISAS